MFKKLIFAAAALTVLTYAQTETTEAEVIASETTENVETTENIETTETVETVETVETTETVTEVTEETTVEQITTVEEVEVAVVENEEGFTASGTISGSGTATGTITVTDLDINGASSIVVPTAALVALAALLH